jgi:DNA-binding PadR family transcriptional regulator
MALRDVLLGLLADRPDHAYSLKHRLSPGLASARLINDGVLYPLLARLEREGLLNSELERHRGRVRRRYHTTAAGRRAFSSWLASDADEDYEPTHELYTSHPLVKLLFGDRLSEEQRREKLERHRDAVCERLATLERVRDLADPRDADTLGTAWLELEIAQDQERLAGLHALLERQQTGALT